MVCKQFYNKLGISLIEVLVVLVITSIFIFNLVFDLSNIYQKLKLKLYLNKTENLLKTSQYYSRIKAPLLLKLTEKSIETRNLNSNLLIRKLKLPKSLSFKLKSSNEKFYKFYSSGVQTPFTLVLEAKNISCKLILSLRGRIKNECS